jgi:hypothetical protein
MIPWNNVKQRILNTFRTLPFSMNTSGALVLTHKADYPGIGT